MRSLSADDLKGFNEIDPDLAQIILLWPCVRESFNSRRRNYHMGHSVKARRGTCCRATI